MRPTLTRSIGGTERKHGSVSARLRVSVTLLIAILLAGCTKDDGPVQTNVIEPGTLSGTVTDVAMVPLAGVNVTVDGTNESAITDAAGAFAFTLLPGEYVVLAQHGDHRPGALRASVLSAQASALAFTLEPIPRITPRVDVAEAAGYLGCGVLVLRAGETTRVPCGDEDPNDQPAVEFPITSREGLETVVVEVAWEPGTDAASALRIDAAIRAGDDLVQLGGVEGQSPLSLSIPGRLVQGDTLVVTAGPAGSFLDEEAGADVGLVFQQDFAAYASLFYYEAAPGGYSALSGGS